MPSVAFVAALAADTSNKELSMKIASASIFANRDSILQALKENGLGPVRVYYCGSGDSGGIEDVDIEGGTDKKIRVKFIKQSTSWDPDGHWNESIVENEIDLEDAIREHCYDLLSRNHCGWENNDGGSGEFVLDASSEKITWTHHEYYMETNTTEHEA